nr:hypothetical protein [uncultured Methanoregula sp.]
MIIAKRIKDRKKHRLEEEDIMALDHEIKKGIQKHYKSKACRNTDRKTDLIGDCSDNV